MYENGIETIKEKGDKMERLFLVRPSIEYRYDAVEYIREHLRVGSSIHGSGGLHRYVTLEDERYEEWLEYIYDSIYYPVDDRVPTLTYFLVRESDHYIIGMINIRLRLNNRLARCGGHIGYGIRPSERGNGYNHINLYLGLEICDWYGLDSVVLDCNVSNPASERTMVALGGNLINEFVDPSDNELCHRYEINVSESLENYRDLYGQSDMINIRR
mgnify:CR=1 FL=1